MIERKKDTSVFLLPRLGYRVKIDLKPNGSGKIILYKNGVEAEKTEVKIKKGKQSFFTTSIY